MLTLKPEHGYLVISTSAICFYGLAAGGIYVGGARSRIFSENWAKSPEVVALAEEHKKTVGTPFPKNG